MSSKFPLRLVLASGNAGKVAELQDLLSHWHCQVIPQSDFATPSVEENGDSFAENALLKARAAARHCGLPAIADDSGLEVDALKGAPGIFSARYAGSEASDADNNQKLLQALRRVPMERRNARFRCALVYLSHWQDPKPLICQAQWEGLILEQCSGEGGFGYDPLFFIPAEGCTSAQLSRESKNRLSHRGQALQMLLSTLQGQFA
jgi:XTP/dITP diphosphohydrolase